MPKLSFLSARAFDAGLAALAAASAGFVAFAMPDSLFSRLVETSRLPELVAAARPPLGDTARLAATGAAALVTFGAVWALLAFLGRAPSRAPARAEAEADAEAPRLRRADAHPDAPARRPLLARDLGEPLELDDFADPRPGETDSDQPEPGSEREHRPLPAFLIPQGPEPESIAQAEPDADPSRPEASAPEPQWPESEPQRPEPEARAEEAPQAEADTGPLPLHQLAAQLPDAEEDPDQSLSQLVNRIEFGLSRKRQALPAAPALPAAEEPSGDEERVGHRLRSAIADLQKIASSGA